MVEDQDPVEGRVGRAGEWGSATEMLEGRQFPGSLSTQTLREEIMDEEGPRGRYPCSPALQARL